MLQLLYEVSPDESGVYDGRDVARQLIEDAYQLLVPYVKACPACADALFSAIANDVIETAHQESRESGDPLSGITLHVHADHPGGKEACADHLEHAVERTRALLAGVSGHVH